MEVKAPKVKTVLQPKNKGGGQKNYKDPPRYPNVINGYENQAKRNYANTLQKTINDLTKEMVKMKKN
jgi:hypothetical protein